MIMLLFKLNSNKNALMFVVVNRVCMHLLQKPLTDHNASASTSDNPAQLYLQLFPTSISFRTSSVHLTSFSWSPTTCTCCFPSSSTLNLALRFRRSNTWRYKRNCQLWAVQDSRRSSKPLNSSYFSTVDFKKGCINL